ncbi:MAG TPA: hypothetical protein VK250_02160 [Nitrososphaeraceae archaeon]|nr:hypothetical protein [Nitrososphaeraceae archaeon]
MTSDITSLDISTKLKNENIIKKFAKDKNTVVIELNRKYNGIIVTIPIDIEKWSFSLDSSKLLESAEKKLRDKAIKEEHINLIKDALDYNFDYISGKYEAGSEYLKEAHHDIFGTPIPDFFRTVKEKSDNNKNNGRNKNESVNAEKKEEQQQRDYIKAIYTQKYCGKYYLAEGVIIGNKPFFAVSKKSDNLNELPAIILQEFIPLDETTIMKPPELTSYLNKPYVFESEEKFYEYIERAKQTDIYSIFRDVKSIWKKYIDADDFHISICAADAIFTHFQDKIGLTHYLFFVGNNGSGKSNNLVIFHYLGYRNMMSTDVTAANIYQFLGNFDEGQGTICEDEADNIDENTDKMRIYKNGYASGFPVYRTDTTYGRKQYRYFTFCFKAFAAEKTPDSLKAKGFNQRIIELHCSPGFPEYDISEIINPAGDEKHQLLLDELLDTRKLLLAYRLVHFHDKIPDIKLNIENREKQLFKPIARIFGNSKEMLDELLPVISKYISQKRESNLDSLHSRIYALIKRMVKEENSAELESGKIWQNVKEELNGEDIKPQTIQTSEFGYISQKQIIQILKDVFRTKPSNRHGKLRSLVFDLNILEKLGKVYDLDVNIKVERKEQKIKENETDGTHTDDGIGLDKHLFDEGN